MPDVRLRIGHAQMPDDELEAVMVDFVAHKFDLLLSTTIVESGLDIPNANTIFIDEADRYGLADLHQLRGRVGRYKNRAYCYLLVEPHKHLTPNAARRLRAIEEFDELGAGFAIAMRDLEIRGAGNLLGTQQSGHIAAVGYELYCQLLENAVRTLQKQPPKVRLEVDINLPGDAFLPPDYVPDLRLKIDLYRRLTRVSRYDELEDFRTELVDRFGEPPRPVERLAGPDRAENGCGRSGNLGNLRSRASSSSFATTTASGSSSSSASTRESCGWSMSRASICRCRKTLAIRTGSGGSSNRCCGRRGGH